jgi:hypothetical protein
MPKRIVRLFCFKILLRGKNMENSKTGFKQNAVWGFNFFGINDERRGL